MKKLILRLLGWTPAHVRLYRIEQKKINRIKNIEAAFNYLHEWNDIPIRELFGSVCDILKIKKNKAAYDIVVRMNMDLGPEDLIKIIPLER